MSRDCEAMIVGGGIVGLAVARSLTIEFKRRVMVMEAESQVGTHQTNHNSGVIHSGVNYAPGSMKARLCHEGAQLLFGLCKEHSIAHERCGKLIVATHARQLPMLAELQRRAIAGGLAGVERIDAGEIQTWEPHARGVGALRVPQTGIVDFAAVARVLADDVRLRGGMVITSRVFERAEQISGGVVVQTSDGLVRGSALVNCAGLQSDRVAVACCERPDVRIVPFRGEYFALSGSSQRLVRNLIYPAPDPQLPFLGVHFTRTIHGDVEVGPNAVLCLARHGYRRGMFNARDVMDTLCWPGSWKLAMRGWRTAAAEWRRSLVRSEFLRSARELVPELELEDFVRWRCGIRAQAVDREGRLVDDFRIVQRERMIHVLNAPSPAATASLAIGRYIARMVEPRLRAVENGGG